MQKHGRASGSEKEEVVKFYVGNIKQVNNWDLVDLCTRHTRAHLMNRDRRLIYRLAKSGSTCERRIAIVATLYFIRNNDFADTLRIAEMLLHDGHDLIHKAATSYLMAVLGQEEFADHAWPNGLVSRHFYAVPPFCSFDSCRSAGCRFCSIR